MVKLHPHAKERLLDRGATEEEVIATVEKGKTFPAKFGRTGLQAKLSFWRNMAQQTICNETD